MKSMPTLKLFICFVLVASFVVSANVKGDTVIGNGGFETAGMSATDSDLWNEFSGGAAGTLSERDTNIANAFDGASSHHIVAIGADMVGAAAGINQNSVADGGLLSLDEGTDLTASFFWNGNLGPGGVAFAALRILDGTGAVVADTGLINLPNTMGYTMQTLPTLTVPAFGAAPADTYAAFFEVSVAAGAFDGSFAEGFVDGVDVQGSVVPEPASAGLVGALCIGMLIRRRR